MARERAEGCESEGWRLVYAGLRECGDHLGAACLVEGGIGAQTLGGVNGAAQGAAIGFRVPFAEGPYACFVEGVVLA